MHELGLARSIVDIAIEAARADGAERIARVGLRVGAFAGVEADALGPAFELARRGTPASDAVLDIEPVPLRCHCAGCDRDFGVDDVHGMALCPTCGAPSGDVLQGMELEVSYIEVVRS